MTANKAWTALISSVIFPYLANWGIGPDTTVEQLITIVVAAAFTAVLTYFVPNKPVIE
jgi:hypothetical protein